MQKDSRRERHKEVEQRAAPGLAPLRSAELACERGRSPCLEYIAHVKGIDLKGIQVETTPANKRAFAFYLRHGFKPMENRRLFRNLRHGKRKQKRS
ncbi:MAG: hypothetical protein QME83_18710 [Thermodesulfobacteriota bacterium]|nr:hypothetical protein [Thermodesulfobacteriota bacterium]